MNHDVRLTDVFEDADGSLLFVDMGGWYTYGFPGNPIPKPESLGGIYRVRRKDAPPIDDPWGKKLKLATLSHKGSVAFPARSSAAGSRSVDPISGQTWRRRGARVGACPENQRECGIAAKCRVDIVSRSWTRSPGCPAARTYR